MRIHPFLLLALLAGWTLASAQTDYQFDAQISRPVLENYLARAITFSDFLHGVGNVEDNIRLFKNTGAKFIGRAIYRWGGEASLPKVLAQAKPLAEKVHQADPEIILQAACFEIVTRQVNELPIPVWVLKEFGLEPEPRPFRYEQMLYPEGQWGRNHWGNGASVPDMSQLETRLWFFYLAASYIDLGVEAIHFGQVEIMDNRDKDQAHWRDLLNRVRRYAAHHARRHLVLCDAHVPSGGMVHDGQLMFDLHSFPLRIDEVVDRPQEGVLKMGYLDSLFGRSKGGLTPSGWACDHLPYLVELDNFEPSGREGQNRGGHWIWGYDEICWFARQTETYRNQWLRYAWNWIREHDPNGFLQMPGSRTLAVPANGKHWYWANTAGGAVPDGFNQEETIKAIWAAKRTVLFDGKTFAGWEGDTNKTWRIENGALVGGSLEIPLPRNEFLSTTRPFTNFVLRLKFKLTGRSDYINAGVQVRSQRVKNPPNEMCGYQADLGDPGYWGCLYDESRRNRTLAQPNAAAVDQVLKRHDWNLYEIRCEGKRIRLTINELQTVDYTEPAAAIPQHGLIGLQIHGGAQAEARYKDITVEVLP